MKTNYTIFSAAILIVVLLIPFAAADLDKYFSVYENNGPYDALPGDTIHVGFTLQNRDMLYPKNVTVYLDPCPYRWTCDSKTLSFNRSDKHPVNLTLQVPQDAVPNKYSMYIKLSSEFWTTRGDDNFVVTVLSEKQAKTLSYEEYKEKYESPSVPVIKVEPEPKAPEPSVLEVNVDTDEEDDSLADVLVELPDVKEDDVSEDINSSENKSAIIEDLERLESSRQFVEYASIVLVIVLVFMIAGAYMTFRKVE